MTASCSRKRGRRRSSASFWAAPPGGGRRVLRGDVEEGVLVTDKLSREEQARAFGFETRQLHAGQRPHPHTGARAVPIFPTPSYVFEYPGPASACFYLPE